MDIFENCTEAQREAITCVEGPLMILAGAGSGKTRVITRRVAYLMNLGVEPDRILSITFTNKAAEEMRRRVEELVGKTGAWLSTFHSMCARILRSKIQHLGLSNDFTIYDDDDSRACVKRAMDELSIRTSDLRPGQVLGVISRAKTDFVTPDKFDEFAAAQGPFYRTVALIYPRYEAMLHAGNCLDFDDLLIFAARLLREHPDVLASYAEQFQHVCVDEFQDTNRIQYLLAKDLGSVHKNICVVGDPDQTIYTWRGSTLQNVFDFEKDFPGARVIKLEQNFRSTKSILRAASGLIKHNKLRKEKDLVTDNPEGALVTKMIAVDEMDEAAAIVRAIRRLLDEGKRYSDVAVLYRTNAQSRPFEEAMVENGVPYVLVGAVEFFRRKEIKDVLAFMRLVLNTGDDVSFIRAVEVSTKGIGPAAIAKMRALAQRSSVGMAEMVLSGAYKSAFSGKQAGVLDGLRKILESLRAMPRHPVESVVEKVIKLSDYRRRLREAGDPRVDERIENLDELMAAAIEYDKAEPEGGLQGFLERVALVSDTDNLEEGPDRVTLMTLHSAKGLEFPVVFITGLEEGLLPHMLSMDSEDELEEERRLFFVGMTRARERLVLTNSLRRVRAGRYSDSIPSRFLSEIPPEAVEKEARIAGLVMPGTALYGAGRDEPITGEEGEVEFGIRVGDFVRHREFGTGKVLKLYRSGSQAKARIFFQDYGERVIMLQYANLERVDED
jgi:DNA helicase-2/ATP-dependent DNA helicase PcrA